jgi:hypothetical protein
VKRWAKVALGTFALTVGVFGWAVWAASGTAPYVVSRSADAVFQIFGEDPRFRCWHEKVEDSIAVLEFVGARQCYYFGQQQVFNGIYFDEFEGQLFLEGTAPSPKYIMPKQVVWLTFDEETDRSNFPISGDRDGITRVWAVSFLGKKTSLPGNYGHLGGSEAASLQQSGKGYVSCQLIENSCKF